MNILSNQFNGKSLLKYALPSILMMVFMSTYVIVDGIFVAHLVGEDALSAINIVFPMFNLVLAIGLMFSTGGTAIMGRLMGEGREAEARSFLSLIYLVVTLLGLAITATFLLFPHQIVRLIGASDALYSHSIDYLTAMGIFTLSMLFQVLSQAFFVLAGRPTLGFSVCLAGGLTNMVLDYVFIGLLNLGIAGAGYATGLGNCVPALCSLGYFLFHRKGSLYFQRPVFRKKLLGRSMFNGLSELVTQLSMAITTILFNIILLDLAGESGVASICVILYLQTMQAAIYFGYSIGVAPIISYKFGAQDHHQLKKIVGISFRFLAVVSLLVIAFSLFLDDLAVSIFISPDSSTFSMAKEGLRLFSITYLFMGVNVFMSSLFTSLSNGAVSATLSLTRTLIFLIGSLLLLPSLLGLTGVWLAVPLAELLAFILAIFFFKKFRKTYHY